MYSKSIPPDKIEGEVGDILKTMQPMEGLINLATDMFKHVWEARRLQAADALAARKKKIDKIEHQIGKAIDQMMSLTNDAVINRFEQRITDLEKQKALLVEKQGQKPEPKAAFEEKLELALRFLSSPWKLWESE
ncbi:MAG: hypothetical protein AAF590_12950 [Pseudomonadota bacterium]